jgi:hypothetical protein
MAGSVSRQVRLTFQNTTKPFNTDNDSQPLITDCVVLTVNQHVANNGELPRRHRNRHHR